MKELRCPWQSVEKNNIIERDEWDDSEREIVFGKCLGECCPFWNPNYGTSVVTYQNECVTGYVCFCKRVKMEG